MIIVTMVTMIVLDVITKSTLTLFTCRVVEIYAGAVRCRLIQWFCVTVIRRKDQVSLGTNYQKDTQL